MNDTSQDAGQALTPVPANKLSVDRELDSMTQVAQLMAKAKIALPAHFHNAPGECLAIVMLARDWNMNPYAVGQKTSIINNRLMYEGQLVQAAINNSGILEERFNYTFTGEGERRTCTATARLKGDKESKSVTIGMPKPTEARNSPLWKSDPDQQLTYKVTRVWVRRYAPEILLGVYTPEDDWSERQEAPGMDAVNSRLAALTTQPSEPVNTIEGEVVKDDPFAEGADTVKVKGFTVTGPDAAAIGALIQGSDIPGCDECLDQGMDGGCPGCGKEQGGA